MKRALHSLIFIAAISALALGCGKHEEGGKKKGEAAEKKTAAAKSPDNEKGSGGDEGAEEDAGKKEEAKPAGPSKREIRMARVKAPANVAAAPADATKLKTGVAYKVLAEGKGTVKPSRDDVLTIRYTAWDTTGKPTSTTWKVKTQKPRELVFRKLIPGWQDVLKEMVVGERRLVWIPAKRAYVNKRNRKKGPRTVDMELVSMRVAPPAPSDLRRPPKDATKTKSGLVYKKLKSGDGKVHPKAADNVKAKYAGWSMKGICFDYTGPDEQRQFNLGSVIKGWTEGVQLMVVGDKYRFWIPEKIGYDGMPGKPGGKLVFDVELVKILK